MRFVDVPLTSVQGCPSQRQPSEWGQPLGDVPMAIELELELMNYVGNRPRISLTE